VLQPLAAVPGLLMRKLMMTTMTIHVGRVAFSAKKILGQRAAVMRDLKSSWGNT